MLLEKLETVRSSIIPFRKILFPTDFSEASRALTPQVREMAIRCGAEVTVLHSFDVVQGYTLEAEIDPSGERPEVPIPYVPEIAGKQEEELERLEGFAREWLPDVTRRVVMEDGDPGAVIRAMAEREGSDLIMMATRGRGTLQRLLLGSVTATVLHAVNCAVLTSSQENGSDARPHANYRQMLCAVELNSEAESILRAAAALAELFAASLSIVHVARSHPGAEAEAEEKQIGALLDRLGMGVPVHVLRADVPAGIAGMAAQERADLVIVGRGQDRAGGLSRLRSDLYGIIREAPCPVLSV